LRVNIKEDMISGIKSSEKMYMGKANCFDF
jgi:hypothetical protein